MSIHALVLTAVYASLALSAAVLGSEGVSTTREAAAQLHTCLSGAYEDTPATFTDFLRGKPSSLFLFKDFSSSRKSNISVTVFAAVTLSRLDALGAQCRSWQGPYSAAIYVPLLQQNGAKLSEHNQQVMANASLRVDQVFQRLESEVHACVPVIQLLYELVQDEVMAHILPVNLLRNAALLPARTPLVAMVDVDLLLSQGFSDYVSTAAGAQALESMCSNQTAVILPAFETNKHITLDTGVLLAIRAAAGSKDELLQLVQSGLAHYFGQESYSPGHSPTDFPRWFSTKEPYQVGYHLDFEPWFVMARKDCPPYDARFRGYGWNKVQQVAHTHFKGIRFVVDPHMFMVHRPHSKSKAHTLFYSAGAEQRSPEGVSTPHPHNLADLFHLQVFSMWQTALLAMRNGTFQPEAGAQARRCMQALPWWNTQLPAASAMSTVALQQMQRATSTRSPAPAAASVAPGAQRTGGQWQRTQGAQLPAGRSGGAGIGRASSGSRARAPVQGGRGATGRRAVLHDHSASSVPLHLLQSKRLRAFSRRH